MQQGFFHPSLKSNHRFAISYRLERKKKESAKRNELLASRMSPIELPAPFILVRGEGGQAIA
jgi:hypothetical protein